METEEGFLKERESQLLGADVLDSDVSVEDYLKRLCALYVEKLMQHANEKILEFRLAADEAKAEMRAQLEQHGAAPKTHAAAAVRS